MIDGSGDGSDDDDPPVLSLPHYERNHAFHTTRKKYGSGFGRNGVSTVFGLERVYYRILKRVF